MQKIVYKIIGIILAFAVTQYFIAGFHIETTIPAYFLAALVFLLSGMVIAPILKLIFFPINLLTLGLFQWIINIIFLYIFDLIYAGITISAYSFPGYTSALLTLPPAEISLFWTLFGSSMLISLTYNIFNSLFHD